MLLPVYRGNISVRVIIIIIYIFYKIIKTFNIINFNYIIKK